MAALLTDPYYSQSHQVFRRATNQTELMLDHLVERLRGSARLSICSVGSGAGLFEIPTTQGWCALTNHVSDDAVIHKLSGLGVKEFPENKTTRARRGKLVAFCRKRNGFCTMEEVMDLIGQRDDGDPGSIHNRNTIHLTFASPQVDSHTLRVMQPLEPSGRASFEALAI